MKPQNVKTVIYLQVEYMSKLHRAARLAGWVCTEFNLNGEMIIIYTNSGSIKKTKDIVKILDVMSYDERR